MPEIFVYGTLKRGGANHGFLAWQQFVAEARTAPGYTLYELDGFPGMVADPADQAGVAGEIWDVDHACLVRLDQLEGVGEGLYARANVPLAPPHAEQVQAYLYARDVTQRRRLGSQWVV